MAATVCQACGRSLRLANRYLCLRILGQGGFGRTFLAEDSQGKPPRSCVIKQNLVLTQAAEEQRFYEEAKRLQQLGHHPQIPRLLAMFEQWGELFLVQEYIAGPNLDQRLQRQVVTESQVEDLLMGLLPVLEFIHQHQVIHRDIKPANIIWEPSQAPVLVDFGAAKAVVDPRSLQQTATVIGSAGYAAPEQALGKAVFASDIYSLGVVAIHMLTGEHPFDLYSVSEDRWCWRPYVQTPVRLKLARVLDRMVARSLRERYSSAPEVLADLTGLPTGSPPLPVTAKRAAAVTTWQSEPIEAGSVVTALAVSPDGRALATGGSDRSLKLWDLATGELIHAFTGRLGLSPRHQDEIVAVAFTPDGRQLISTSRDGSIFTWELAQYRQVQALYEPNWEVSAFVLSPDGELIVSGSGAGKIHLWHRPAATIKAVLGHHQDRITSLQVSSDGQWLVSGSRDRTVRLWSLPAGRLIRTFTDSSSAITAVAYQDSTRQIFSANAKGVITCQADQPRKFAQANGPINDLAISPDGRWLAAALETGTVQLWDLTSGGAIASLPHHWSVLTLAFASDSHTLVSSSRDQRLYRWRRGQD
ncbi:hypothetical protein C7271_19330 [filamentous cyanobacterium CCP5]|nr:hypothetical protein C7271_19330 [filamentous cyanobacterium CCP5]